jgi:hypothetical protein
MGMELLQPPTVMPDAELDENDYADAAAALNCEVATIKAVTSIEAPRGPFDPDGRPAILFERHVFHRLTNGAHDASDPDISNASQGGYGHYSEQYAKLIRAAQLDYTAALESCSWGAFQIMGEDHRAAGFQDVDSMVVAMQTNAAAHLAAFVSFIKAGRNLPGAIQRKDWKAFAFNYNGAGYASSNYDGRLAEAYAKFA